jgi:hypothetical protein
MQYFDTLPKIINIDSTGNSKVMTNLLARASVIPEILKDPLLYYTYDIQEGDTPEIIAHKYYGDSYRYWIVLFANELLDPQWDWPMTSAVFEQYLADKYPSTNVYSEIEYYEKVITQYDVNTQTTTVNRVRIDENVYNSLPVTQTATYTLPTGPVTITTDRNAVSIYDYELNQNEAKRNIKILNSIYVNQFEEQFKQLLTT